MNQPSSKLSRWRRGRWLWLAAGAAIAAVTVAALLSRLYPSLQVPFLSATATPYPAITTVTNGYGFATSLATLSQSDLDTKLSALQASGATWVRFDLDWSAVQANNASDYDWQTYDRIAQAVSSHHLHAIAIIDFTPSWARGKSCSNSKMCPPNDPATFGKFAGVVAARYTPDGITSYEIWNEPNISYRYHPRANPEQYAHMLEAAYRAIKAVNQNDLVITGGTAPSGTDSDNLTPADFLAKLYAAGAGGFFDAVAAHPYTYPDSPADNLPLSAWGQLSTMHRIMVDNGDGAKQIWITEFGAPTNGPNEARDHVSEARQATILADALKIHDTTSWLGPFMYYDYQDEGTSTVNSENFYGLVRADGTFKPAYAVWTSATQKASHS